MSQPFQLKVGQKYKDRKGRIWKVTKYRGERPLCFICECESEQARDSYTKDGCVLPPLRKTHCNGDFVELIEDIGDDGKRITMTPPRLGECWESESGNIAVILGDSITGRDVIGEVDGTAYHYTYPAMGRREGEFHLLRRVIIDPSEQTMDKPKVGERWAATNGFEYTVLGFDEDGYALSVGGEIGFSYPSMKKEDHLKDEWHLVRRVEEAPPRDSVDCIMDACGEAIAKSVEEKIFSPKKETLEQKLERETQEAIDDAYAKDGIMGKPLFTEAVRVGEERLCVLNPKPTKGELEEMIKKHNEESVQAPPAVGEMWLTMLGHHVEITSISTFEGKVHYICGDGFDRYPIGGGSVSPDRCLLRKLQANEIPKAGEEWMHHDGRRVKISSWSGAAYAVGDSILLKGPFMGRIDGYVKWNYRWWPCTTISRTDKVISVKTFVDEWFIKVEPDGLHAQPDSTLPIAGETQGTPEEVAVKIAMGATLVSKETALKNASAVSDIPFVKDLNALHEPMTKAPHVESQHPLKDFRFTIQRGTPKWEIPIARPEGINESRPSEIHTMSFTITKDQPDCGDVYRSKTGMIHFVTDKAGRNYSFNGLSWVLPWHLKNQCQKIGRIPKGILDDIERRNGNDHRAIFVELSAYFGGMTWEQKSLCKMQAEEPPAEAKSVITLPLKKGDVVKLNDGRIVIVRTEPNNHHSHRYRVITETGYEDIRHLEACASEKVGEIDEEVLEETIERIVDNSEDDIYSDYRAAYKALKPCWEKTSPQAQETPVSLPAKEEPSEATKEEVSEIELKVGQKYKARNGTVWTVLREALVERYDFSCQNDGGSTTFYTKDGHFIYGKSSALDLVELVEGAPSLKKEERLLIEIGKRYKDREGNIWDVTGECQEKSKKNGFAFLGRGGRHGQIYAFTKYGRLNKNRHRSKNDLVELVGESPLEVKKSSFALPEEQIPLKVGKLYKDREGRTWKVMVNMDRQGTRFLCHCHDTWATNSFSHDGFFQVTKRQAHKNDLVELVDETLDTQADLSLYSEEAVTPSASVEDRTMSSKAPNTKQDVGVESSRFNDYLQREIEDLRAGVESRDQRIHELNNKIQDLIQQKHEQAAEFSRALFQLATREKQEQDDNVTALAMKIEALHALTATGVDCMTEELANAIERIDSQASDVATILERTAPKCPAPKEDDSLDKGLKITHRALTAIEITWKVIKFIVALSLVGGGAALTASMILGKI